MLTVGDKFPEYSVKCNVGSDPESLKGLTNADYDGKWVCYFFYPKDFTFICPTEIADMDYIVGEADVIGISGDNEHCKLAWKEQNDSIRNISTIDIFL